MDVLKASKKIQAMFWTFLYFVHDSFELQGEVASGSAEPRSSKKRKKDEEEAEEFPVQGRALAGVQKTRLLIVSLCFSAAMSHLWTVKIFHHTQ